MDNSGIDRGNLGSPAEAQASAPCAGCKLFRAPRRGDWKDCTHPDSLGNSRVAMDFWAAAAEGKCSRRRAQ